MSLFETDETYKSSHEVREDMLLNGGLTNFSTEDEKETKCRAFRMYEMVDMQQLMLLMLHYLFADLYYRIFLFHVYLKPVK